MRVASFLLFDLRRRLCLRRSPDPRDGWEPPGTSSCARLVVVESVVELRFSCSTS